MDRRTILITGGAGSALPCIAGGAKLAFPDMIVPFEWAIGLLALGLLIGVATLIYAFWPTGRVPSTNAASHAVLDTGIINSGVLSAGSIFIDGEHSHSAEFSIARTESVVSKRLTLADDLRGLVVGKSEWEIWNTFDFFDMLIHNVSIVTTKKSFNQSTKKQYEEAKDFFSGGGGIMLAEYCEFGEVKHVQAIREIGDAVGRMDVSKKYNNNIAALRAFRDNPLLPASIRETVGDMVVIIESALSETMHFLTRILRTDPNVIFQNNLAGSVNYHGLESLYIRQLPNAESAAAKIGEAIEEWISNG